MKETLRGICARELDRLNTASEAGSLTLDDVKKLEILTRSLKQLEDPPKAASSLSDITDDDLLALVRMGVDDVGDIKPEQEGGGNARRFGPKKGRRGVVEAGADKEDAP